MKLSANAKSPWFINFPVNKEPRLRLFCFHYAGGNATIFRLWSEKLPDYVQVVGVELPGRGTRFSEPLVKSLVDIISSLENEMTNCFDLPYIFFGHSLGALISHALICELSLKGEDLPIHAIFSGRPAPSDNKPYYKNISSLPDEEFFEELRCYNGTPGEILENKELMDFFTPVLRSDFSLAEGRQLSEIVIDCPVTVFGGSEDRVSEKELMMWSKETTGLFKCRMFKGGHFFLKDSEDEVLQEISSIIHTYK